MPYKTRKVRNKNCYKVYNQKTKRVFAKCTTKKKARKQVNILKEIMIDEGFHINPYKIRKVPKKNCYMVYKPITPKVFAKCTTKTKAIKQERLLRAIIYNKSFKANLKKRGRQTRKLHK